jgi:hypothetical protein
MRVFWGRVVVCTRRQAGLAGAERCYAFGKMLSRLSLLRSGNVCRSIMQIMACRRPTYRYCWCTSLRPPQAVSTYTCTGPTNTGQPVSAEHRHVLQVASCSQTVVESCSISACDGEAASRDACAQCI